MRTEAIRYRCSGIDGRILDTCPGHATLGGDCAAWDEHMAQHPDGLPDTDADCRRSR